MIFRLVAIGLFITGAWLGVGVAAFIHLIVSGWMKIALAYAVVLAALWIFMWSEDLLDYVFGAVFSKVFGSKARGGEAVLRDQKRSRSWLLAGVCAGFAVSTIWAPSDILKLFGTVRV